MYLYAYEIIKTVYLKDNNVNFCISGEQQFFFFIIIIKDFANVIISEDNIII